MSNDEIGSDTPSHDTTWTASRDVLAAGPGDIDPAAKGRSRWASRAAIGGAGVLAMALIGGVTVGVGALTGDGGSQPADALPTGAFGLVSLDLDPSVGQKLDGYRFLRKFPTLRDKVPLDGDVRKVFFDAVSDEAGWGDVDYESDVAPWLGKRLAVGIYAPEGTNADGTAASPTAVVALQVTDRDKAAAGLKQLSAASTAASANDLGWAFSGDYALLAETADIATRMAAKAEGAPLSEDSQLKADLAEAEDGVAVAWFDLTAAARELGAESMFLGSGLGTVGSASAGALGRATMVARFDGPDVFEVVGRGVGTGTAGWATHGVEGLDTLPQSSAAVLGIADGGSLVPKAYDSMKKSFAGTGMDLDEAVAGLKRDYDITIPDDLAVLLGDNMVVALDGATPGAVDVGVGARISTDVPAASAVLDKVEAALGGFGAGFTPIRREVDGDLVLASTEAQADRLAAAGTLGDLASFTDAVPDRADAAMVMWADVSRLMTTFGGDGGSTDKDLAAISGVGLTVASPKGADDVATYRFRLVAR